MNANFEKTGNQFKLRKHWCRFQVLRCHGGEERTVDGTVPPPLNGNVFTPQRSARPLKSFFLKLSRAVCSSANVLG